MLTSGVYLGTALFSSLISLPVDFVKTQLQLTGSFQKVPWRVQFRGSDVVLMKGFLSFYTKHKLLKSTYESDKTFLIPSMTALAFILTPFDLILVKLQTRHLNENVKISNIFNTFRYILQEQGFRGLYRGAFANTLKNFSYFLTGEQTNLTLFPYYVVMWKYFLGMVSLIPAVLVSHPFDVIKAHMQYTGSNNLKFLECVEDLNKRLGIQGFYRGVTQAYARNCFVLVCSVSALEFNQLNN